MHRDDAYSLVLKYRDAIVKYRNTRSEDDADSLEKIETELIWALMSSTAYHI